MPCGLDCDRIGLIVNVSPASGTGTKLFHSALGGAAVQVVAGRVEWPHGLTTLRWHDREKEERGCLARPPSANREQYQSSMIQGSQPVPTYSGTEACRCRTFPRHRQRPRHGSSGRGDARGRAERARYHFRTLTAQRAESRSGWPNFLAPPARASCPPCRGAGGGRTALSSHMASAANNESPCPLASQLSLGTCAPSRCDYKVA